MNMAMGIPWCFIHPLTRYSSDSDLLKAELGDNKAVGLEHCSLGYSLSNPSTAISGSVPGLKSMGLGAEG